MSEKLNLGDVAKDTISGYEGVVVCVATWLHGCRRITIQPLKLNKDGAPHDGFTFDEPQLKLIKRAKVPKGDDTTGGPRPEPRRNVAPR